jgi:cell fate regulator YaaT (PSP1 superfamily)
MDLRSLASKSQEEAIAVLRCTSRVRARRLPMEIVDAEYQWDRNKLTFYFKSESRIDFRELVRELFRIYKTRIWMCAIERRMGNLICTLEDKQEENK